MSSSATKSTAVNAVISGAKEVGIKPEYLGAIIGFETGGTYSTDSKNQFGYIGLIHFSPELQIKYKITPGMSFEDQMKHVVTYLKQHGAKPGDDLVTLYKIVNQGNRNAKLTDKDGNGRTVGEYVQMIESQHLPVFKRFLEDYENGKQSPTQEAKAEQPAAPAGFEGSSSTQEDWSDVKTSPSTRESSYRESTVVRRSTPRNFSEAITKANTGILKSVAGAFSGRKGEEPRQTASKAEVIRAPSSASIAALLAAPGKAAEFDAMFGRGSAEKYLRASR